MNLAIHNLLQDKLRFVLSVTGVALAVMLILFLLGVRQGMLERSAWLNGTRRRFQQAHRAPEPSLGPQVRPHSIRPYIRETRFKTTTWAESPG